MEKFLLSTVLTGDKLNIVDEKNVRTPVFIVKCCGTFSMNSVDNFTCKGLAGNVNDFKFIVIAFHFICRSGDKVGFSQSRRTVYKEGVIYHSAAFCNGCTSSIGKFIGTANDKCIECIVVFCIFVAFFKFLLLFIERIKIYGRRNFIVIIGNSDFNFYVETQSFFKSVL